MNLLISPLVCSFFLLTGWSATALAAAINLGDPVSATLAATEAPLPNPLSVRAAATPRNLNQRRDASQGSTSHLLAAGPEASLEDPNPATLEAAPLPVNGRFDISLGSAKTDHFGVLSARKL
jgi:hypothetical protein